MDWELVVGYGPALSKAVRQFMKSKRPRASQARSYLMLMATLDVARGWAGVGMFISSFYE